MATLVLGVVGAAVGFVAGGPVGAGYGWAVGTAIGSAVERNRADPQRGPRLDDLTVQSSSHGKPIPDFVATSPWLAGNVIWASEKREYESVYGGGKGGQGSSGTSQYSYVVDFAVLLTEGEISRIRRVKANKEMLIDFSIENTGQVMPEWLDFTLYRGNQTQLPDATMEAVLGVGNTPAYRGLCYVMFRDFELNTAEHQFYGEIPQLEFEIVKSGPTANYSDGGDGTDWVGLDPDPDPGEGTQPPPGPSDPEPPPAPGSSVLSGFTTTTTFVVDSTDITKKTITVCVMDQYNNMLVGFSGTNSNLAFVMLVPFSMSELKREYLLYDDSGGFRSPIVNTTGIAVNTLGTIVSVDSYYYDFDNKAYAVIMGGVPVDDGEGGTELSSNLPMSDGLEEGRACSAALTKFYVVKSDTIVSFDHEGNGLTETTSLAGDSAWNYSNLSGSYPTMISVPSLDDAFVLVDKTGFIGVRRITGATLDDDWNITDDSSSPSIFQTIIYDAFNDCLWVANDEDTGVSATYSIVLRQLIITVSAITLGKTYRFEEDFSWDGVTLDSAMTIQPPMYVDPTSGILYIGAGANIYSIETATDIGTKFLVNETYPDPDANSAPFYSKRTNSVYCPFKPGASHSDFGLKAIRLFMNNDDGGSGVADTTLNAAISAAEAAAAIAAETAAAEALAAAIAAQTGDPADDLSATANTDNDSIADTNLTNADNFETDAQAHYDAGLAIPTDVRVDQLKDVVTYWCQKAGVFSASINATTLSGEVRSQVRSTPTSPANMLADLMLAYQFECVFSGCTLKFTHSGMPPPPNPQIGEDPVIASADPTYPGIFFINEDNMDASGSSGVQDESIDVKLADHELPKHIEISFLDQGRDNVVGSVTGKKLVSNSNKVIVHELPLVLTEDHARRLVNYLTIRAWMEKITYRRLLPVKYSHIAVSDVVGISVDGQYKATRVVGINQGVNNTLQMEMRPINIGDQSLDAIGGISGAISQTPVTGVAINGVSQMVFMDMPILLEGDNDAGVYIAIGKNTEGQSSSTLHVSDDETNYTQIATISGEAIIASTPNNRLEDATGSTVYDAELTIQPINSGVTMPGSTTLIAMYAGANHFAYGAPGRWEIIAAKDVTDIGNNRYTLSTLLRGRNGTEWACGLHTKNDTIVYLNGSGIVRVELQQSQIGATRYYKAVMSGSAVQDATAYPYSNTAVGLKPYAPTNLRLRHMTASVYSVTYTNRTRFGGEWLDSIGPPLNEATEEYNIQVWTGSTLRTEFRVYTTSTAFAVYSGETVRIAQVSNTVGIGYYAEVTLP